MKRLGKAATHVKAISSTSFFLLFRIYAAKTYPEWQAFTLEYLQKKYNAASNTFPEKKEMFTVRFQASR